MIEVTKLNRQPFYINCELIEMIEETPDTVITTTTGKKIVVLESAQSVLGKMIHYKRQILRPVDRLEVM